jgi:hypothetical protein
MSQFVRPSSARAACATVTGLPVLGAIGMNWTPEQTVKRKRRLVALGISVLVLFGVYGAGMAAILVRPTI